MAGPREANPGGQGPLASALSSTVEAEGHRAESPESQVQVLTSGGSLYVYLRLPVYNVGSSSRYYQDVFQFKQGPGPVGAVDAGACAF